MAEAEVLSPGTRVRLTCSGCGFPDWHHEVVWEVERYIIDVDDYALRTNDGPLDGEAARYRGYDFTYARREAMEILSRTSQ